MFVIIITLRTETNFFSEPITNRIENLSVFVMPKRKEPGRALVRKKNQRDRGPRVCFRLKLTFQTYFHAEESADWCRLPVKSITQETSLDDFFHTANLSNTDFTARLFIVIS